MCLGTAIVASPGAKASEPLKRPNILFCLADDVTWLHMGAYGCTWVKTPGFDRIARDGVLFTHAYTPNAKCAPSRSSILTGRNSWQLKEAVNHYCYFPEEFKTYAEVLGENGYFVGSTGKGWAPGDPGRINGKQRELTGQKFDQKKLIPPTTEISNNDYAANFSEFLSQLPKDQPFCFWYGSLEPHRAYEFKSAMTKGGKKISDIDKVPDFWPDNETVRTDMLDYAYELEHFDSHLEKMVAELEKRGLLENTIVVVTSDNGMPFPRAKGQEYEYSNHLPLAVMWKAGITNPGRKADDFISFIDLAPTFLEAAGIGQEDAKMQPISGTSFMDILKSGKGGIVTNYRNSVLVGKERHDVGRPNDEGYPIRGIFKGDMLYLINFKTDRWPAGNPETGYLNVDGSPTKTECIKARKVPDLKKYWQWSFGKRESEELYNVKKDPFCLNNLSNDPGLTVTKEHLRRELLDRLKDQHDPRVLGYGDIFDKYPYAGKEKGIYEKWQKGKIPVPGWINASDMEVIDN
ncbi:MAG TPA: sulfatase [Prolixibacteraceae bacterium]|nr:sulfatase [Prolixibacteraceae bacterium]